MARKGEPHTFLTAEAADDAGTAFDVDNYDEVIVFIGAPAATDGITKCRGTILTDDLSDVNWQAAGSVTNQVDGIAMVPLESAASVVKGDTGVVLAAEAHGKLYRVNTLLLRWLNFITDSMVAGSFTVNAWGIRKTR